MEAQSITIVMHEQMYNQIKEKFKEINYENNFSSRKKIFLYGELLKQITENYQFSSISEKISDFESRLLTLYLEIYNLRQRLNEKLHPKKEESKEQILQEYEQAFQKAFEEKNEDLIRFLFDDLKYRESFDMKNEFLYRRIEWYLLTHKDVYTKRRWKKELEFEKLVEAEM